MYVVWTLSTYALDYDGMYIQSSADAIIRLSAMKMTKKENYRKENDLHMKENELHMKFGKN